MTIGQIVTGIPELNEQLARLRGPQAKAAIRKASRESMRPVAAAVKAGVPKRTGALSRAVKVRAIERSRTRIGSRVTTDGSSKSFKGRTYYGAFNEWGWRAGRRVRNVDIGAVRGAKRTTAQKAEVATRNAARRKIPGTGAMKAAAVASQAEAMRIYEAETARWMKDLSKPT